MRKKIYLFSFVMMMLSVGVCTGTWAAPFAYITNWSSNDVYVIDTATNTVVGSPIPVEKQPYGVAVNPAGTRVYVANANSNSVSVIDSGTNTVVGSPIPVGTKPYGVAVNPAGTQVYVTNYGSNDVYVIDTATNTVVGSPIPVGTKPYGVAVNPAGTQVYVADIGSNDVYVIDTGTNTVIGSPIPVGTQPEGVAVNPAGTRVYVTNVLSDSVSVIDTGTNTVIGSPIPVGTSPLGVAINPSGTEVYVTNYNSNNVSVIDTSTNTVIGSPIPVMIRPVGVAVNPSGTRVYVANIGSSNVSVIDTSTRMVIGSPIPVGSGPQAFGQFIGPAISPNDGTIGTEFATVGSGFGANKGKVLLGTATLKIMEWTDESIQCQLAIPLSPGTYDVTVKPKAKGSSTTMFANGFTVKAPEIDSVEPNSGSIGDDITIHGFFFGTKRGKVTLGGKSCKVTTWTMDSKTGEGEIKFVVPRGLTPGAQELKVTTNGVGVDTTNFTVD